MIADLTLVLLAVLVYLTLRSHGGFLRVVALGLVFFLIANPAFRKKSSAPAPVLAVCLDTSLSMDAANGGESRIAAALDAVRKNLPSLRKKFKLLFYSFDTSPRMLEESAFFKLKASGKASLISKSIAEITGFLPEDASLLVLSDGRDTSSAARYFSKPAYCAGFGRNCLNDMSVKILAYPEKAFQGAVAKVRVRLERSAGCAEARVRICRKGATCCEKKVLFSEGQTVKECDVEFIPAEAGQNVRYTVELSPSDGKPENNHGFFSLSVFKSKIKVMFISGRPGWEYRNLRALIKSDSRIDLTSFVILRNPSDYVPFPDNKLSLIPFPVREIFLKDITQYDLVILLNFDYTRFLRPDYLLPLAGHVKSGGSLMLIGGENLFNKGSYFKSPLSAILPFKAPLSGSFSDEEFFLEPSPSHPVTSRISAFRGLASTPLKGMSPAGVLASGAQSVLAASTGKVAAAVKNAGKGRVMVVLTNSMWRLFFGGDETSYFYQEFFKNSFAWLTRSPLLDEISLSGRKRYKIGEELSLRIKLRNIPRESISVRHIAPSGMSYLSPVMISPGFFNVKKLLRESGRHSVRIFLSGEHGVREEKEFAFDVEKTEIETADTSANHSHLREISRLSLGKYLGTNSFVSSDIPYPEDNAGFYRPAMKNYYLIFMALFFAWLWFKENTR
ncbi:MAG: hypothetical protein U9O97_00885 [Elusimicrobiota bacterium]|nr:hypothetical protein [Elusimicrobiota bacterium]